MAAHMAKRSWKASIEARLNGVHFVLLPPDYIANLLTVGHRLGPRGQCCYQIILSTWTRSGQTSPRGKTIDNKYSYSLHTAILAANKSRRTGNTGFSPGRKRGFAKIRPSFSYFASRYFQTPKIQFQTAKSCFQTTISTF